MEFQELLLNLRKSKKDWQPLFLDGQRLLSRLKKADGLSKAERTRFRAFIKCDGNTRLMEVRQEPFSRQEEVLQEIARQMHEEYGENEPLSFQMAWTFLAVICNHFEKMEESRRLEEISEKIFSRKIKEDRRFELLSRSHNPYELYELGEICLKSEDYFQPEKAREFYEKAAENGISDGLFTLGLYDQLDEKNFDQAHEFYTKLLEYGNPKGWSGLALLEMDSSEGNPYYSPEKAREDAQKGYDQRCGTSMYILSSFLMPEDKKRAYSMALRAASFDANLASQLSASTQFIQQIADNLSRVFPAYAKAAAQTLQETFRDLQVTLYASKYNLSANYTRFLSSLKKLVLALKAYYSNEGLSEKTVLQGLGINAELLDTLLAQYTNLDEEAARLSDELKGWLASGTKQ